MKLVLLNRKDFPVMNMGFEGGAVYTAGKDGMFYVITFVEGTYRLLNGAF